MSNKTPKAKDDATVSVPKVKNLLRSNLVFILISIAVALILLGFSWYRSEVKAPGSGLRFTRASINGEDFHLEVADTPASRTKGLGGREGINPGEGMLFVFALPDIECFWMKDVDFNIDILWFDADKHLIHSVSDLSPSTYPSNVCPPTPSQYVVELPAGTIRTYDFDEGDTLEVENL